MNKKLIPLAVTSAITVGATLYNIVPTASADDVPLAEKIEEANKDDAAQSSTVKAEDKSDKFEDKVAKQEVQEQQIVQHILFEGNHSLKTEDLMKLVTNTKIGEPYSKEIVRKDLENIAATGIAQTVKARAVQNNGELYIVFDIEELSEIKSLKIAGNTLVDTEELTKVLSSKVGEQFNRNTVEKDIDAIKSLYKEKGYIAIVSDVNNNDGNVVFNIAEARIEGVNYEGNTKTKDWVLDKITSKRLKKGDFLTTKALEKVYTDLAATGFFKDIKLDATEGSTKGEVILKVKVEEDKTGEWRLGGGYSSNYKSEIVGGISDKNLRGEAKSINFDFGFGKERNRFSLSYVDPYWRKSDTAVYGELFKSQKDIDTSYSKYDEKHTGGTIGFSKPVTKDQKTRMYANFTMDKIDVDYKSGAKFDSIKENTVTLGVIRDSRAGEDEKETGTVTEAAVTVSPTFLGSDENYTKFLLRMKNYAKLSAKDLLASRVELHYSPNTLPAISQFTIGGADSVRGLNEDAQRGNKSVLASMELRHDISSKVQGVVFVDAGKAWSEEVSNSFKVAAGLGLRIKTAMGILRLDAAKSGGEGIKYMFGIGQSF